MFYVLWALSLAISFGIGYVARGVHNKLVELEEIVKTKVDKPRELEEPTSEVIDVLDPIQTAIYEHQKEMKRMNPGL